MLQWCAVVFSLHVAAEPILVDPSLEGKLTYDGHGALSAGASSRLLYDYEEPMRSQILDFLYKPNFGASLHHVKVEIGGDSQSTDGTEASHMHHPSDLNCHRGYEWWLLEEARKRNPDVVTHALSWAVPEWVGNDTYYSADNIDYHISWLKCVRDEHPDVGNIDYMGIWNERSWGNPRWIKQFRAALDGNGFGATKLILPDGGWDGNILKSIDEDADFGKALSGGGIGLHYPCNQPHPEVHGKYGLKYWSSEDFSTEADWAGAGCWGRVLNQNFVRMKMTSTISWSLVWAVYDDWPYFGNGLMYAYWPWSGHYTVNEAIWTSAHHCQFMKPGWSYVAGNASGSLPHGGSYVTLVDPLARDVTIVVEKLHGNCLRCAGQSTQAETIQFKLMSSLERHSKLAVWSTNKSHHFVRLEDAVVDAGVVTVDIMPDSIMTLSSTTGQQKGSFRAPPADTPFPLPYEDKFESRKPSQFPKFFSDNGGSFELAIDPLLSKNQVLAQVVDVPPSANAWVADVEPITVLGSKAWGSLLRVSADALLIPSVNSSRKYQNLVNELASMCLDVRGKAWSQGAVIDVWNCVHDYNEKFWLDEQVGLLRISDAGGPTNMCVSSSCAGNVEICQQTCDEGSPNQKFELQTDHSVTSGGKCLEVQGSEGNSMVRLAKCDSGNGAQHWHFGAKKGYVGVCLRVSGGGMGQKRGNCFNVNEDHTWSLTENNKVLAQGQITTKVLNTWLSIVIESRGPKLEGSVGGHVVGTATAGAQAVGRVALASGWNLAYFDNFAVRTAEIESWTDFGAGCCTKLIQYRSKALFDNYVDGGLKACKQICSANVNCGFIMYGWANSTWCVAWPLVEACESLDAGGEGHCGSRGDTGVHTYAAPSETVTVV